MLKTAIAVEPDLASRIAIRYACQLGRYTEMSISTIHAPEPGEEGRSIATGWVRQTWEDAVVLEMIDQVNRLVKAEQAGCRLLESPLFLPPGDSRENRIAEHLRSSRCRLFVEGLLHRFRTEQFMAKIGSWLYRSLPCPILLVQNVPPPSKGVLWISQGKIPEKRMQTFLEVFPAHAIDLEILTCRFGNPSTAAKGASSSSGLEPALSLYESAGRPLKDLSVVEGTPSSLAALVRDHFLIVSSVPVENSPMAELLSKSPCPLLFVP